MLAIVLSSQSNCEQTPFGYWIVMLEVVVKRNESKTLLFKLFYWKGNGNL
jgi:hypothetical protein